MACPENNMHPQTESKKKAIAAIHEHLRPYKKRRSILHDLTTVSNNAVAAPEKSLLQFNKPVALLKKPCIYDDIYEYLRCMEVDPRPLPDYIEKVQCKDEVTASTRAMLVGQLVEICHGCQLGSDILHSCVAYIDRFLSLNNWTIDKMVLLGFSALVLASKYEKMGALKVEDVCYLTGPSYSMQKFVKMEADILKALKFELGCPTVKTFLTRFSTVGQKDVDISNRHFEFLSNYIADLSLLDYYCIKFLPSLVAASIIFLTRFILRPKTHPWNSELHQLTRNTPGDMKECILNIHNLYLRSGSTLEVVREIYRQTKFACVATTPISNEIPPAFFEYKETDHPFICTYGC